MTDHSRSDDRATARQGAAQRAPGPVDEGVRAEELVGARIGHFVLRAKLGAGGMGVVYEAMDERLGRVVALKMLLSKRDGPEARARFLREARVASRVHHPNVATIFETGDDPLGAYIAMELVSGQTMRAWLRSPPSFLERLSVAREIAAALTAAHARGVIHRDLKPENVIVTKEGAAKVLDFGLAKQSESTSLATPDGDTHTAEGIVLGTPSYMSPEQVRGAPLDARSDVFSFGVVLYEMFSGVRPFRGESPGAIYLAIGGDPPPPPRQLAADLPRSLDALIMRCLAKRPDDRFADGAAVARALEAVPVGHDHPSKRTMVATLGFVVVLGAALGLRSLQLQSEVDARTAPRGAALLALHDATSRDVGGEGDAASPSTSALGDAREAMRRGLLAQRELAPQPCAGFEEALRAAEAFAPAALRLALCRHAYENDTARARVAFEGARKLRHTLAGRDLALFEAWEPALGNESSDLEKARVAVTALAERFADDVEIVSLAALANETREPSRASALFQRVADGDPGSAFALSRLGQHQVQSGDGDLAHKTFERCLSVAPLALPCAEARLDEARARGACAEVEAEGSRLLEANTSPAVYVAALAIGDALLGKGTPLAEVRATIEAILMAAQRRGIDSALLELIRAKLDLANGDVDGALARAAKIGPASPAVERELVLLVASARRESRDQPIALAADANANANDAGGTASRSPWLAIGPSATHLERAAHACDALRFPLEHMESNFVLGQAREAAGDPRGACAAYSEVLRPGRVSTTTARKARARAAALICTVRSQ